MIYGYEEVRFDTSAVVVVEEAGERGAPGLKVGCVFRGEFAAKRETWGPNRVEVTEDKRYNASQFDVFDWGHHE